uniref:uncharacterized protein LOC122587084 n=1 Tax=Erigeron canadensis TaxID=72917 RepID=UPI001CB8CABE|nr:uncharacterized protein LOC122587084 [Erigeron canadensis]
MALLPSFFVMQATSGGPYLSVPEDLPASVPSGFLKFHEKQIWSPRAKFEAVQAETGDGTLVNIRCCYNNKYLTVHKTDDDGYWVIASANEPQEDQTDPSCTLFQPQTGEQGRVCLFSVGMSKYATASTGGADDTDWADGLKISDSEKLDFNIIDWETLVVLPSQVSFKYEGKYLCSRVIETTPYLRFESGLEAEDPLVVHQLFPTSDGNYRIKDLNSGKFWKEGPSKWILDDGDEADDDTSVFSFVKITDGVFAVRSLGSKNFCGTGKPESLDDDEEKGEATETDDGELAGCLNASYPEITKETRLIVEERVAERDIFDITYRLSDARIYNKEDKQVAQAIASNYTNEKDTFTLTLSASGSNITKWTNDASVATPPGVKVNFKVTAVPVVTTNDSIELTNQYIRDTHEWGVAETTEVQKEVTYATVVPPFTSVKVTLGCSKAACDVPFSYTQRDVLVTGEVVTTVKDDGMFFGVNHYGFYVVNNQVSTKGTIDDQSAN